MQLPILVMTLRTVTAALTEWSPEELWHHLDVLVEHGALHHIVRDHNHQTVVYVRNDKAPSSAAPGPQRPPGSPSGPDEVRRAALDAAARLSTQRSVSAVSLRDIADGADVKLALIGRYIGKRDDLIEAVMTDLSE